MILLDRTVSGNLKSSLMNSDGKNELNVKTKCKIIKGKCGTYIILL